MWKGYAHLREEGRASHTPEQVVKLVVARFMSEDNFQIVWRCICMIA
jgi:hypothetical protein